MLFSVVMPTYNRLPLAARALDTVLAQRFGDFEVIVADDGSTDGTAEYAAALGPRVRVVRQPNRGPGAARNLGVASAAGRYIAFLDSDDVWFPWTLATIAAAIAAHGEPALVALAAREFRDESELAAVAEEPARFERHEDFLSASSLPLAVGSGLSAMRRDAFDAAGGFETRRMSAEDHDLVLRLGTARGFVRVLQPVVAGWRRHPAGASMDLGLLVKGSHHMIGQENAGAYPGGAGRARARREVIARHVRPVSLECLRAGRARDAWSLYSRTLRWHLGLNRWRYLLGFPARAAAGSALQAGGHAGPPVGTRDGR